MSTIKALTIILISLLLLVALPLTACNTATTPDTAPPPDTGAANEDIRIGLLIPEDAPFFSTLRQGAEEAANRLNATLVVSEAGNDITRQNEQIQEIIDMGLPALIITPVDSEAVVAQLEAAAAAGIAIFTVDRSATSAGIIAHIASDNVAGGKMAGDYLAEVLQGRGQVVELEGIAGTSAAQDRGAGFNEAIALYTDIELVSQQIANFNRAEGQTVFAEILAAQPDIDAVFAHNDEMILGAILAAQEAGRAGEMVFIGFDAVDDAITAIEAGDLLATIAQQPAEMGRLGVETAVKHLQGETVPTFIAVDLALITR